MYQQSGVRVARGIFSNTRKTECIRTVVFLVCFAGIQPMEAQIGKSAYRALGQPDLTSYNYNRGSGTPAADSLAVPFRLSLSGGRLAVADYNNNRVLIWNSFPTAMGQAADLVLGQPGFTTGLTNMGLTPTSQSLAFPSSADFVNGQRLTENEILGEPST